jgi:hypothetical protein
VGEAMAKITTLALAIPTRSSVSSRVPSPKKMRIPSCRAFLTT